MHCIRQATLTRAFGLAIRPRARGSALVAVLLLTPALALIGAACLELGALEGARVRAQIDARQALLWAESGLVRSNWALTHGANLEAASTLLPAGIVFVAATQSGRTTGPVAWSGAPVALTAVGEVHNTRRTARAQYQTSDYLSMYKNVLVSPGNITVQSPNPPAVVSSVNGPVLTGDATTDLSSVLGNHPMTVDAVPLVDVDGFITRMLSTSAYTAVNSGQITSSSPSSPYLMDAVNSTRLYYTNDPGLHVANSGGSSGIQIRGTVFWLIRNGAYFGKEVQITAYDASARLVIVASEDPSNLKGWDLDKLGVINVPTVLVSDGQLYYNKESALDNISMYGSSIYAAKGQDFRYDPAIMDPFIDQLKASNELPPPVGVSDNLARLPGTWEEVLPSL